MLARSARRTRLTSLRPFKVRNNLVNPCQVRPMSRERLKLSHEERTAREPREQGLHPVILRKIEPVNETIRLLHLGILDKKRGVKFLPGQWLDVHIPGLYKAGGFTITSTPRDAEASPSDGSAEPYLELAVQRSPTNPPAAWLWRPVDEILGAELIVRVGGSFVWPPPGVDRIKRAIFVAGGVGINPLISIVSHLHQTRQMPEHVHFMYGTKMSGDQDLSRVLFLPRLLDVAAANDGRMTLELFLTGDARPERVINQISKTHLRRLTKEDILAAIGEKNERPSAVCYVCGPPQMTDKLVEFLQSLDGLDPAMVLCEKWW